MNLQPVRYTTCPVCKGDPLQIAHEMKPDRAVMRATICGWCNGMGLVRLPDPPPSQRTD